MSNLSRNFGKWKATAFAFVLLTAFPYPPAQAARGEKSSVQATQQSPQIISAKKINPTTIEVLFSNKHRMTLDFYGENIFRMFQDNSGGILRDPEAKPEAKILVNQPRKALSQLDVNSDASSVSITTGAIKVQLDKNTGLLKVINLKTGNAVLEETEPILFEKERVTLKLKEQPARVLLRRRCTERTLLA